MEKQTTSFWEATKVNFALRPNSKQAGRQAGGQAGKQASKQTRNTLSKCQFNQSHLMTHSSPPPHTHLFIIYWNALKCIVLVDIVYCTSLTQ
jgi:hypothetical protein